MGKRLNGPMRPIKGGGGLPPWAWRQGWGPPPPLAGALPPFGSLVPHGGGEEDGTPPLAYIRRGRPPFFQHTNISFFLILLPGSGLPLFGVCTWIGVLHHKAGRRWPIKGGGGLPPWAWHQGWAHHPPWPAHSPPLGF